MLARSVIACFALLTACATSGTDTSADAFVRDGCGATGDAVSPAAAATPATYAGILVRDRSPTAWPANGVCDPRPGMDLDCVGLYRGGSLIAVGAPDSVAYFAAANAPCANPHDVTASVAGPLDGHVYADATQDFGYLSLNGGYVLIAFGECSDATSNITTCDGTGQHVDVQSGDEIDVWEIDRNYLTGSSTAAEGFGWDGCTCAPDAYEVDLVFGVPVPVVTLPGYCDANAPTGNWYFGSHTVVVP